MFWDRALNWLAMVPITITNFMLMHEGHIDVKRVEDANYDSNTVISRVVDDEL